MLKGIAAGLDVDRSWRDKTIEELAAEQGVQPIQRLEDLLGAGADLWNTDRELEEFVQDIYRRRRAARSAACFRAATARTQT